MKLTLLSIALCMASPLLATEATVEVLTTAPVTLLWSNDAFQITSGTNKGIIPIAIQSKFVFQPKSSLSNIPDVPNLYYQPQISVIGGIEQDTSFYAFSDLDGNEIRLKKDQLVELLRLELSVSIDGQKSRIVLWKQQKN